jgi:hypothetical protein
MSDQFDGLYERMTPEQLSKAVRRHRDHLRLELLAVSVCLVAGIWFDWRFLPTTLVPLAAIALTACGTYRVMEEVRRRFEGKGTA